MASPVIVALAVGAVLITACDVSQKTPQTSAVTVPATMKSPLGAAAPVGADVQQRADMPAGFGAIATGEKSIRLYGPGVSRKRQTRV
jgi:hypothetical protein